MIRNRLLRLAALFAALLSSLAGAQVHAAEKRVEAIEEKKLVGGKQSIDPEKGYIFTHGTARNFGWFIKTPDADDLAKYEADWREALEKAKKRYPRQLANWETDVSIARQTKNTPPPKPVEPTEQNFSINSIELRLGVGFGPQYVFSKGDDYYSYLMQVEPGTYTYYGPVLNTGNAMGGICYCMGSVRFEVKAGVITNFGDFLSKAWIDSAAARKAWSEKEPDKPYAVPLSSLDYAIPQSLAAYPAEQPDLQAAGKMNNFYGIMIGRMPPVDGVLGYERDTVIDLRAAAAAEAAAAEQGDSAEVAEEAAEEAADTGEEVTEDATEPAGGEMAETGEAGE